MPTSIDDIPEVFRPSEWLTEIIPRKAPYYPQMGDEIVYFRQGHQFYLDAVRNKKVYELGPRCEPWNKVNIRVRFLFYKLLCEYYNFNINYLKKDIQYFSGPRIRKSSRY